MGVSTICLFVVIKGIELGGTNFFNEDSFFNNSSSSNEYLSSMIIFLSKYNQLFLESDVNNFFNIVAKAI